MKINKEDRVFVIDMNKEGTVCGMRNGPPSKSYRKPRHAPTRWYYLVKFEDGTESVWRSKYGLKDSSFEKEEKTV